MAITIAIVCKMCDQDAIAITQIYVIVIAIAKRRDRFQPWT